MYTVTEYRADMLTVLGDASGRRYSESILDMGLKEALTAYRAYCPLKETVTCTVSSVENGVVSFPWIGSPADQILSVRRVKTGACLRADPFYEKGQMKFYDPGPQHPAAGEILEVTAAGKHTVRGLEKAAVTTVPESHTMMLVSGAAGYAMRIRTRSVTEVFGKRPEDREALSAQAERLLAEFERDLQKAARRESFRRDPWEFSHRSAFAGH